MYIFYAQVGDVTKIGSSDVSQQTSECLKKIDRLLALAGTNKSRYIPYILPGRD